MPELPIMLQTLRKYRGRLNTQLGLRLLMLTGVRTGELRFATPDQFDLEQGLWIIPVARLKQRALLTKKRKRLVDIRRTSCRCRCRPRRSFRHLLDQCKPAPGLPHPGRLVPEASRQRKHVQRRAQAHGLPDQLTGTASARRFRRRSTNSAIRKKWVDAQLSHADPDKISATYNHAEYVEQRRVMMQDWADRLDLFEQNQVEVASRHLTITLQGLPTIAGQAGVQPPVVDLTAPQLIVTAPTPDMPQRRRRCSGCRPWRRARYARPRLSEVQRERLQVLETFEHRTTFRWRTTPSSRASRAAGSPTRSKPATCCRSTWATVAAGAGLAARSAQTQARAIRAETGAAGARYLGHLPRAPAAL